MLLNVLPYRVNVTRGIVDYSRPIEMVKDSPWDTTLHLFWLQVDISRKVELRLVTP